MLTSLETLSYAGERGSSLDPVRVLLLELLRYLPFALVVPVVFWLSRVLPIFAVPSYGTRLLRASLHLAGSLGYSALYTLTFTLRELNHPLRLSSPTSFGGAYMDYLPARLGYGTLVYVVIYAASRGIHFYHQSREREVEAAHLSRELTDARLHVLKNQVRPHFLFNTLHAISSLMDEDVAKARRTLALLADLLRLSLDDDTEQEVALEKELEIVDLYLEIERTRFADRLRVEKRIAEDTLGASVPHFLLQPLVENAVRHGIGSRSSAGTVEIAASARNGRLTLRVRDDGPGCAGERPAYGIGLGCGERPAYGIGLANVEARLSHLYGNRALLVAGNSDGGGFEARVELPLSRSASS